VATWLNIAFYRDAIEALTSSTEAAKFRVSLTRFAASLHTAIKSLHVRFRERQIGRPGAIPDIAHHRQRRCQRLQEEVCHLKATLEDSARQRLAGAA
jgi:hypothetical protein